MKQLLFLLLFPCLAMAQYPGNAGQKITLGEQTSADGLVWRGRTSDTSNLMTNKIDTSAYLVLDTITEAMWLYRASTTPKWNRVVDSLNNLQGQLSLTTKVTGVLSVANGGTGQNTLALNKVIVGNGTSGVLTPTNLHWDNTNERLGLGTSSPGQEFDMVKSGQTNVTYRIRNDSSSQLFQINSGFARWISIDARVGGARYDLDNGGLRKGVFRIFNNLASLNALVIDVNGNLGLNMTTPTARLHLPQGTATASTAPLKFTSGTNLTTTEAGAMEFNGTNLFFSPSTTRHTVNHGLTGSATLNFPSTSTNLSADLTITVTGAADGDVVSLGVPNAAVNANTSYSAWVSAANTVTVRFNNYSSGTVDPASGTFKVFVTK